MDLNLEQQQALALLESGKNVFLTGKAGSGKSFVVREFIRRNRCDKNIVVVAPTGLAALQLNGSTIHHFFEIPIRFGSLKELAESPLSSGRAACLRLADVIVIDEISMVRADVLSALYLRLREVDDETRPKQIIAVGDFQQLPPVIDDEAMRFYLRQEYHGVFAFETEAWKELDFSIISLRHSHRQEGETNSFFLFVLNFLRCAWNSDVSNSPAHPLNQFNKLNGVFDPAPEDVIRLCVYQSDAAHWNAMRTAALTTPEYVYLATSTGDPAPNDYPVPERLRLKVGMRVMLRANLYDANGDLAVSNGELGNVTSLADTHAQVCFDRFPKECRTIRSHSWMLTDYEVKEEPASGKYRLATVELGSYRQLPLIPAYAISVHKAQGLSLPAMQFDRGRGCFEHGQLYTALSRCRSVERLYLVSPLSIRDMKYDPVIADFYEEIEFDSELFLTAACHACLPRRSIARALPAILMQIRLDYRVYRINPPAKKVELPQQREEFEEDARFLYRQCRNYQPEQWKTVVSTLRKFQSASDQKCDVP